MLSISAIFFVWCSTQGRHRHFLHFFSFVHKHKEINDFYKMSMLLTSARNIPLRGYTMGRRKKNWNDVLEKRKRITGGSEVKKKKNNIPLWECCRAWKLKRKMKNTHKPMYTQKKIQLAKNHVWYIWYSCNKFTCLFTEHRATNQCVIKKNEANGREHKNYECAKSVKFWPHKLFFSFVFFHHFFTTFYSNI